MPSTDADPPPGPARERARQVRVTPDGHDLTVWRSVLADARRITLAALLDAVLPGRSRERSAALVLASAHPDDETLGGGRLAYTWSTQVGPVVGVLATLGEACVDHVMARPPELAERRLAEWRLATERLGFSRGHVLGLPDGSLSGRESDIAAGVRAAVAELCDAGDQPVVLAAPWRGDPHPDHQAVGRAVDQAASELGLPMIEYPVWMTYWSTPRALQVARQELVVMESDRRADEAHGQATREYVSQIEPLTPYATPVVPAAMLEHHREQLVILAPEYARRLTA